MKKIFTLLSIMTLGVSANAQVVINEVYGGGGNTSAPAAQLKCDFIELYNPTSTDVVLTNAYIQYGSATGVFGGTQTTKTIYALPSPLTVKANGYYLIQGAAGAGGTVDLINPDATIAAALSASGGKIALATNSTVISSATDSNVIDLVGWSSSANIYEGSGPAPATANNTSISRAVVGVDTNDNKADFASATIPTPTNSTGAQTFLAVYDINSVNVSLVKNTVVKDVLNFGAKANVQFVNMNGQVVKSASVEKNTSLNVSSLPKGVYVVTGEVNGQSVSQKIVKE